MLEVRTHEARRDGRYRCRALWLHARTSTQNWIRRGRTMYRDVSSVHTHPYVLKRISDTEDCLFQYKIGVLYVCFAKNNVARERSLLSLTFSMPYYVYTSMRSKMRSRNTKSDESPRRNKKLRRRKQLTSPSCKSESTIAKI